MKVPFIKGWVASFCCPPSNFLLSNFSKVIEKVMALLSAKGICLNAMITGDCSQENDWNELPE
jgi:hypothetical protein